MIMLDVNAPTIISYIHTQANNINLSFIVPFQLSASLMRFHIAAFAKRSKVTLCMCGACMCVPVYIRLFICLSNSFNPRISECVILKFV